MPPCGPLLQFSSIVQCNVAVAVDQLLGTGERDMGLEPGVFQLEEPVQVAHCVQTTHVDPVEGIILQ